MTIDQDTIIDDATKDVAQSPEQPAKKRGRPAGGAAKPKAPTAGDGGKKSKISARQLTGILYLGHSGAAEVTKTPEIAIDEAEAAAIASAMVDVLSHYDFEASAKTLAWANLFGTMATVYGMKIYALMKKNQHVSQPD